MLTPTQKRTLTHYKRVLTCLLMKFLKIQQANYVKLETTKDSISNVCCIWCPTRWSMWWCLPRQSYDVRSSLLKDIIRKLLWCSLLLVSKRSLMCIFHPPSYESPSFRIKVSEITEQYSTVSKVCAFLACSCLHEEPFSGSFRMGFARMLFSGTTNSISYSFSFRLFLCKVILDEPSIQK